MKPPKYRITLTDDEEAKLQQLIRKHSTAQNIVKRAYIILLANGDKLSNKEVAKRVGMNKCDVTRWTKCWVERIKDSVELRLIDAPRTGAPDRITAEQWSHKELAKEIVRQNIVDRISPSHLGTVLKKKICNPIEAVIG